MKVKHNKISLVSSKQTSHHAKYLHGSSVSPEDDHGSVCSDTKSHGTNSFTRNKVYASRKHLCVILTFEHNVRLFPNAEFGVHK